MADWYSPLSLNYLDVDLFADTCVELDNRAVCAEILDIGAETDLLLIDFHAKLLVKSVRNVSGGYRTEKPVVRACLSLDDNLYP